MTDPGSQSPAADKPPPPFPAYCGDKPFIFVSYAHDERHRVFPEIVGLHELGFRIWYDEGIPTGATWKKDILEHVRKCQVFLVFLSPFALSRPEVVDEIRYAYRYHRRCVAVLLEATQVEDADLDAYLLEKQGVLMYEWSLEVCRQKLLLGFSDEVKAAPDEDPDHPGHHRGRSVRLADFGAAGG